MRSGELARLTGVSTDTLRHYERSGLLPQPARTGGNYRSYPPSAQQRVELIQRALRIGFSLSELKAILSVRDGGGAPCCQVRRMLSFKINHVNNQIHTLTLLRTELNQLAKDWDQRLAHTKAGEAARLLETVPRTVDSLATPSIINKKGR
ncbi:MAG TPA: heavy metal-responsive transcriptional regulator [Candidatus Dormibacteraeota bacterium]|nr:heavy metal-responsive transcriptional regulator [Candidatus Dormibacteraeota bacterium]